MPPKATNLFEFAGDLPEGAEISEVLARGEDLRVERILSRGHSTSVGQWYDQDDEEWVVVLRGQARLEWEGGETTELVEGDWVLIPAGCRHRVAWTSTEPACMWLAVHF